MDERDQGDNKKHYPLLAIEALQRRRGKPLRRFRSVAELEETATEYFQRAIETGENITVTGLAAWLGTSRKVLMEYERGTHSTETDNEDIISPDGDYEAIWNAIKRVKLIAEAAAESMGYTLRNPAFPIFSLKQFGWKDTQTIENVGFVEHRADPETLAIMSDFLRSMAPRRLPEAADVIEIQQIHKEAVPVPAGAIAVKER